jgi:hypothetical protein
MSQFAEPVIPDELAYGPPAAGNPVNVTEQKK